MSNEEFFKKVVAHCKEYGFVFPSSEIYDGLSAVYDYGSRGIPLKNNLRQYWWQSMTRVHKNIVGIDAAIFMHPRVWKASGHVDGFSDPMIDNKDSKKRYRADQLIEDYIDKQDAKIQKEVEKASMRFGDSFDEKKYRETNPRVLEYQAKIDRAASVLKEGLENDNLKMIKDFIVEQNIVCPISGTCNWTDIRQFNLMYSTQMNATDGGEDALFLRPETAQGIFVNFLNVQKTARMKIPFGIAQTGKAFRNEIVARQFIMRMKEFEQMEMQFFVRPGTEIEWYNQWKESRMKWHLAMGIKPEHYRFHEHDKLAHYANAAVDIEYQFPFGFKELEGIHSRTDFDLSRHQEFSGKKIKYHDPELNESYTPYVIETSIGLDRLFLMTMCENLKDETLDNGETRTVLCVHPSLAPVKAAIMPLVNKDGLPELADEIYKKLHLDFDCFIEEKDSIGKRYRRQDAIGTPFCITVDHESLNDNAVTVRDRDTMEQKRVAIAELHPLISSKVNMNILLSKLD
ncbi:MAG: glycine--tRNA ligase [Bacteroidetes bacterium]|nr:glycine--tRNA ligase [Bacteroidota bacterium]